MSPIPGDPYDRKPFELKTKDGKTIRLKVNDAIEGPPEVQGAVQRNEDGPVAPDVAPPEPTE
ncbi:hypothetical protein GKE82_06895 [Conexibacter sp. W3-3-2]|uniref:Uncharacterized protein n=1 Tax=Paraconexibacter algicola TaxID=2133960 RepID=A0A2T4UN22_9ACTN|nr:MULTISPECIES: hypothetical protein [Solirubrobacterales]MTD44035.1 hypothetical protein [Conexibacter sp. W3-3-2]PTL60624.1 hypothetical protein C7Y72_13740 [Paraconexibacter algicola]